jgi:ABC-type multidrug transport system fused ATPase/permease subunit
VSGPAPVASLGLLLPHLRPYAARAAVAAFALLAAAGLTLLLGQGLKRLVDDGFAGGPAALDGAALFMAGVVAALAFATSLRFWLVSWLGERVAADLRVAVFGHVAGLSPSYFERMRTGDVLSRLTADVALLQSLVGSAISMGLRNVLTGTGALVMLVFTSPKLAGITLLVVPLVIVPLIVFGRRERRPSPRTAQERVADLAAAAEEVLNGLPTVQAFGQEGRERARFATGAERSVQAALRRVASRCHADTLGHPARFLVPSPSRSGWAGGTWGGAHDGGRAVGLRVLRRAARLLPSRRSASCGANPARRGGGRPADWSCCWCARHRRARAAAPAAGAAAGARHLR